MALRCFVCGSRKFVQQGLCSRCGCQFFASWGDVISVLFIPLMLGTIPVIGMGRLGGGIYIDAIYGAFIWGATYKYLYMYATTVGHLVFY